MEYIYVLLLQQDRYYVGKTTNLAHRFIQHTNGEGSKWTRIYKPLSIVHTCPCSHELDEEMYVLEWMNKKGIDHVRGAGFSKIKLSDEEKTFIQKKINAMKNHCFRCNKTGHYSQDCPRAQEPQIEKPTENIQAMSLEELRTRKRPKWFIQNILPERCLACMYSEPGVGKSFCVIDMGLHVAHNIPWHGLKVRSGLVFYIVAEGMNGIYDRIHAWHSYHELGIDNVPFYIIDMNKYRLYERKFSTQFVSLARSYETEHGMKTKLIIIDTMAHALNGLDENSSTEVGKLLHEMLYINSELQCSSMFVHHSTKNGTGMRGSSALLAAVDTSIRVRPTKKNIRFIIEKQKDGEPKTRILQLQKHERSCVIVLEKDMIGVYEEKE